MYSQERFHQLAERVRPGFFNLGSDGLSRTVTAVWPLPTDRFLFARQDRDKTARSTTDAPGVPYWYLFVLDQGCGSVRQVGDPAGYDDETEATVAAIAWLQGLRVEDLTPFDKYMVEWLGEMAYRMTPEHLEQFQREYFAIPSDAWGTHENPDDGPAEHLADLLAAMGYSEHTITEHLF